MPWMERHVRLRQSLANVFPAAASAWVCCFPCDGALPKLSSLPVALCYRGEDYHRRVRRVLSALLENLAERFPGVRGIVCVDSAPVHERALALAAGLGWQGRNGCVIDRELGSCFVLGEILLNVAPPGRLPDSVSDGCGECRRCVEACPGGALSGDGQVDCRRCIAWQTTENRAVIPADFQGRLGGSILGCDLCQQVCPYNKAARPAECPPSSPACWSGEQRRSLLDTLREWSALSGKAFGRKYGDTALARAGQRVMVRNVVALLAEAGELRQGDPLRELLAPGSLAALQLREFFA